MIASERVVDIVQRVSAFILSRPNLESFFPQIVAKAIGDTEAAAMLGLYLLEKRGVATRHRAFYCDEHSVQLEDDGTCVVCETDKIADDAAHAETYFTVDRDALLVATGSTA